MTQTEVPIVALPTFAVELVNPQTAQEWLGHNDHNRNLRRRLVEIYARDMVAGRWKFAGDAVKFDTSGSLLDGQHRLHAVVSAGVTVPFLVGRNLAPEAQTVMDTGAKRTTGDVLSLNGERNSVSLASTAGLILTNGGQYRRMVSSVEVMDLIEADPTIRWAVDTVMEMRLPSVTNAVLGYTFWRLSSIDASAAIQFFDSLSNLVGLPAGSPILALHRRLNGGADKRTRSHAYRQETIACVFFAWNAWRRGDERTLIKVAYTAAGRLSVPEPK